VHTGLDGSYTARADKYKVQVQYNHDLFISGYWIGFWALAFSKRRSFRWWMMMIPMKDTMQDATLLDQELERRLPGLDLEIFRDWDWAVMGKQRMAMQGPGFGKVAGLARFCSSSWPCRGQWDRRIGIGVGYAYCMLYLCTVRRGRYLDC
jgi:hypothetical protein